MFNEQATQYPPYVENKRVMAYKYITIEWMIDRREMANACKSFDSG